MTDRDSTKRRKPSTSRDIGDSPKVATSRRAEPPLHDESTKYPSPTPEPADPSAPPLTVKVEFVVVHGPAADELIKRQAAAVRDVLQWFADHPPDDTT